MLKKVWIISSLMGFAVLGLILIQTQLIRNAYKLNKEKLAQNIESSLQNVAEKLEMIQSIELYAQIEDPSGEKQSLYRSRKQFVTQIDSATTLEKEVEMNVKERYVSIAPTKPKDIDRSLNPTLADTTTGKGQVKVLVNGVERYQEYSEQSGDIENVLNKLKYFVDLEQRSNTDGMVHSMIDSLIREELTSLGNDMNYQYGIITNQGDTAFMGNTPEGREGFLGNLYEQRLYPNSLSAAGDKLFLSISDEYKHVLNEMKVILGASFVFVFIILFSFVYTLRGLVKQERLSQIKSDFINNMTHELKTPITTIALASEALQDKDFAPTKDKIKSYGGLITKENERLRLQVERVLQMAKLDQGKINLKKKDMDIQGVLDDIVASVRLQVEKKGGSLICSFGARDHEVFADELHITNVAYNLIDNAIKYSKEDDMEVSLRTYNKTGFLVLEVEDKGQGMRKEDLKKIFDRFFRVHTGNIHDVKGFGLGLSYVKEIIEMHEGRVEVESEYGVGTTFRVFLPQHNHENKQNAA